MEMLANLLKGLKKQLQRLLRLANTYKMMLDFNNGQATPVKNDVF